MHLVCGEEANCYKRVFKSWEILNLRRFFFNVRYDSPHNFSSRCDWPPRGVSKLGRLGRRQIAKKCNFSLDIFSKKVLDSSSSHITPNLNLIEQPNMALLFSGFRYYYAQQNGGCGLETNKFVLFMVKLAIFLDPSFDTSIV